MGKTHVAVGMATSLLILQPTNPKGCIVAIIGGAIGGVAADIDILNDDYKHDALIGQFLAVGISCIALIIDYFLKLGICKFMQERNTFLIGLGAVIYLVLWIVGYHSDHRKFTHSFLAMLLFSTAIYLLSPMIAGAYIIGYFSHLLLDLLNKKRVLLFYPLGKGMCLKLCYAGKSANKAFMYFGFIVTTAMIIISLMK